MGRGRTVIWRSLTWLWIGLPIVGLLPGMPLRLSVPFLAEVCSLVVVAMAWACPRRTGQAGVFGWLSLGVWVLALGAAQQTSLAFWWATQAILLLLAAGTLAVNATWSWLTQALLACALMQGLVVLVQWVGISTPWPLWDGAGDVRPRPGGTMGAEAPAAILMGVGVLWSVGWWRWLLAGGVALTTSGTVLAFLAGYLLWHVASRWAWVKWGLPVTVGLIASWHWPSVMDRLEIWQSFPWSWWGTGMKAFPGGYADDTILGRALGWRDYHNVYLDFLGRFGLPGAVILLSLGGWIWTQSRTRTQRWTLAFAAWVGCWQSLEQFPVLVIVMLVWWIGLSQQGAHDAVSPI